MMPKDPACQSLVARIMSTNRAAKSSLKPMAPETLSTSTSSSPENASPSFPPAATRRITSKICSALAALRRKTTARPAMTPIPRPFADFSFLRNSFSRRCRFGASAPRFFAHFAPPLNSLESALTRKRPRGGVLLLTSYPIKVAVLRSNATKDLSLHPDDPKSDPDGRDLYDRYVVTSLRHYISPSPTPKEARQT